MKKHKTKLTKISFTIALLIYFNVCAGLWHLLYWDAFNINYFEIVDSSDLIKNFINPFSKQSLFILLIFILSYGINYLINKKFSTNTVQVNDKKIRSFFYLIIGILSTISILLTYFKLLKFEIYGYYITPMLLSIALTLHTYNVTSKLYRTIKNLLVRMFTMNIIFFFLGISISLPIKEQIEVHENKNIKIVEELALKDGTDVCKFNNFKILGSTSNYLLLCSLDNNNIMIISTNEIIYYSYSLSK